MISVQKAEEEYQEAQRKLNDAQRRVREVKEVGLMESLSVALEDLKRVIEQHENADITIATLTQSVKDLQAQVTAELTARVKQRAKEDETLTLLNKYLQSWV